MTVELLPGLHWLHECYEVGGAHEHISVYLLSGEESTVVVDTGSFHDREAITTALDGALGEESLDAIVLSHSDYPHSANVSTLREEWADVELVSSSGSPEIQGLSEATKCEIGSSMDVAGRRLSFVDPPLADRSHTTWIYDEETGALFAADGFGSRHEAGECDLPSDAFEGGIPAERIYEYHRDTLVWLRYVDPAKLRAALEEIFAEFDVSVVAPVHGTPILAEDLDGYLDDLIDAAGRIADEYDVPTA